MNVIRVVASTCVLVSFSLAGAGIASWKWEQRFVEATGMEGLYQFEEIQKACREKTGAPKCGMMGAFFPMWPNEHKEIEIPEDKESI